MPCKPLAMSEHQVKPSNFLNWLSQHIYMGCNDVSEFEHIHGQTLMTPSCVYGRLFTWTRMVDFNALIVWKTFIDICFSIKSSLWTLTAAYTKFQTMIWSMIWSCGHRSRSPMCSCVLLPHRNAGRLHLEKAESIQLFDSWVGQATIQVLKRNSGYDSHDATSLSSFSHPPSDFCPPPFNEGLGVLRWENCRIKRCL